MSRAAAPLLLLLAGCNQLIGSGEFTTADGGAVDRVGVSGIANIRYHTRSDIVVLPADLGTRVSAYAADPEAPGTLRVYPGTATADGRFEIPDVPKGPYYLRLTDGTNGRSWYLTSHEVDLSTSENGGPPRPVRDAEDTLVLSVGNLAPWQENDRLELYVPDVGVPEIPTLIGGGPAVGGTALAGTQLRRDDRPLLQGDDAWLIHVTPIPGGQIMTQYAPLDDLTQEPDMPLSASGTFGPVPTAAAYALDVDRAELHARHGIRGADSAGVGVFLSTARVSSFPRSPIAMFLEFADYAAADPGLRPIDIIDPFPASMVRTYTAIYTARERQPRSLRDIGLSLSHTLTDVRFVQPSVDARPTGAQIGANFLGWPTGATLADGRPLDQTVVAPGAPIAVRWAAVPGATSYDVSVFGVWYEDVAVKTAGELVLTTETEVLVPTAAFGANAVLSVSITAITGRDYRPLPLDGAADQQSAGTMHGPLLYSSTCGNGAPDPDEACDDRGPSPTCDFDCTSATCGDGVLNELASEQCDAGFDAPGCSTSCMLR